LDWFDFPDPRIDVRGLPFFAENSPNLWRFPKRAQGVVPNAVWGVSGNCSGGRLRFRTDATQLALRIGFPPPRDRANQSRIGRMGLDVLVDGQPWTYCCPEGDKPKPDYPVYTNQPRRMRDVCVYLPLCENVTVSAIGINDEAEFEAPPPFALEKPVVYYGSSITQGACASRASLSYPAILQRRLNVDFVNLGFAGNGNGEPEVAELVAEVDAACYVMDFAVNVPTPSALETVYVPFLEVVREKRPDAPIICISPVHSDREYNRAWVRQKHEGQRDVVRAAVGVLRQRGDENIALVEGHALIGPDHSVGLSDGLHPNDLGFVGMANGLEAPLREALGLTAV
jgi:hypothetical protein